DVQSALQLLFGSSSVNVTLDTLPDTATQQVDRYSITIPSLSPTPDFGVKTNSSLLGGKVYREIPQGGVLTQDQLDLFKLESDRRSFFDAIVVQINDYFAAVSPGVIISPDAPT